MSRPGSSSTNDKRLSPADAIAGEEAAFARIASAVAREATLTANPPTVPAVEYTAADLEEMIRLGCEARDRPGPRTISPEYEQELATHNRGMLARHKQRQAIQEKRERWEREHDAMIRDMCADTLLMCRRSRGVRLRAVGLLRRTKARARGRRSLSARSGNGSRGSPGDGPGDEPPAARAVAHSAQALTTGGQA